MVQGDVALDAALDVEHGLGLRKQLGNVLVLQVGVHFIVRAGSQVAEGLPRAEEETHLHSKRALSRELQLLHCGRSAHAKVEHLYQGQVTDSSA